MFGKGGLHHVDRRGEHDAQAQANEEQSWGEVPGARIALDHGHQQKDTGDGRHEAAHDERSLLEPLGQAATDLSPSAVIDWRQIAAERADPVTASNRDRITPQIHILLDQPGVPRSCFIEGQPLMSLRPRQGYAPRHFGPSEEDPGGRLKDIGQLNLSPVDRAANRGSLLKPAQQTAGAVF
jgi:hypothetical protein